MGLPKKNGDETSTDLRVCMTDDSRDRNQLVSSSGPITAAWGLLLNIVFFDIQRYEFVGPWFQTSSENQRVQKPGTCSLAWLFSCLDWNLLAPCNLFDQHAFRPRKKSALVVLKSSKGTPEHFKRGHWNKMKQTTHLKTSQRSPNPKMHLKLQTQWNYQTPFQLIFNPEGILLQKV